MEAMENLLTRRSCRNYSEEQVPDELLDKVLEAGTFAAKCREIARIGSVGARFVAI